MSRFPVVMILIVCDGWLPVVVGSYQIMADGSRPLNPQVTKLIDLTLDACAESEEPMAKMFSKTCFKQ